jgi:hypothetical protein
VHCRPFGGDGCAANCTNETDVQFNLVMGSAFSAYTTSTVQLLSENLFLGVDNSGGTNTGSLVLSGSEVLTIGKQRNNQIPVVVKASSVTLPGLKISTLACACVRGITAKSCGGTLFDLDGVTQSEDCTFTDTCAADSKPPCAAMHGAGNTASGVIGCVSLGNINFDFRQDAGGTVPPPPPTPPAGSSGPMITLSGSGGPGSALLLQTLRIGNGQPVTAFPGNPCRDNNASPNPNYGADKIFCTNDDPDTIDARGSPQTLPAVTGVATAQILNHHYASSIVGPLPTPGPLTRTGAVFSCAALTNPTPSVTGAQLVGAFTALNQVTLGDIVVTNGLVGQ